MKKQLKDSTKRTLISLAIIAAYAGAHIPIKFWGDRQIAATNEFVIAHAGIAVLTMPDSPFKDEELEEIYKKHADQIAFSMRARVESRDIRGIRLNEKERQEIEALDLEIVRLEVLRTERATRELAIAEAAQKQATMKNEMPPLTEEERRGIIRAEIERNRQKMTPEEQRRLNAIRMEEKLRRAVPGNE